MDTIETFVYERNLFWGGIMTKMCPMHTESNFHLIAIMKLLDITMRKSVITRVYVIIKYGIKFDIELIRLVARLLIVTSAPGSLGQMLISRILSVSLLFPRSPTAGNSGQQDICVVAGKVDESHSAKRRHSLRRGRSFELT